MIIGPSKLFFLKIQQKYNLYRFLICLDPLRPPQGGPAVEYCAPKGNPFGT